MAVPPYVEGGDGTGQRRQPVDAARLWTGGLATAVVAGLVALVGVLIARGLFDIPVLAPAGEGALGNSNTAGLAIGSLVSGRPGARSGSADKPRGSPSAKRPGAAPVAHPG